MKLNELKDNAGARQGRKRLGRGIGSGLGKTSGKGHKGAKARTSNPKPRYFEGGQMPLYRRLPKRGFTNIFKKRYALVNLRDLADFPANEKVTPEVLLKRGLIKRLRDGVKVLGDGELKAGLHIAAHVFSKPAAEKIQKAGGTAEVLQG
jgi:large subunit ribosomal protein L15